jgi:hypothetical protein
MNGMINTDGLVELSTTVGKFWIEPYGLNCFTVYDESRRTLVVEKTARGWQASGSYIDRRTVRLCIRALKATGASQFTE